MATIYDPKTADDQYETYNTAAVVFDLGEDTSIGSGFSTIKSRDVTIKMSVRKFGQYKLKWEDGLRVGISVSEPSGFQIFTTQLDNILSSDDKYQLTVSLPVLNTEVKYAVQMWAGDDTKSMIHRETIEVPDYQDPSTQRENPENTVVYHEGYYPDDEQWERDQPYLPSGFERPVPPT